MQIDGLFDIAVDFRIVAIVLPPTDSVASIQVYKKSRANYSSISFFMNPTIVTLKAFGDFVIACNASRRIQTVNGMYAPKVVAGEHVRSLASALGVDREIQFIGDDSWSDVPAAFDVRKHGALSALRSLQNLRHRLDALPSSMDFVFDHSGWRERFIGGERFFQSLSLKSGNIYLAYDQLFESLGYGILKTCPEVKHAISRAIIIPGARIRHKQIPAPVLSELAAVLRQHCINTSVVVLEGESIDLPAGIHVKKLPRNFGELVAAVKDSDLVISADSLPSHLSEFLGVPVFVSTPSPKPYWLPRSAYLKNGWATFADIQPLRSWLNNNKF